MVEPLPVMVEEEELLERCADWLCRWLQSSQLIDQADPAFIRRVTPHSLSDPAFIAAAIRGLSCGTHQEPEEMAEQSEDAKREAAATCLSAILKAERSVDVDAVSLIQRAVQAGVSDLEPLGDIVDLWRHILLAAVSCEAKEKHIDCIQQLPHDLQEGLVQTIEVTEQFLMNGRRGAGNTNDGYARNSDATIPEDNRSCPASSPRGSMTPRDRVRLSLGMDEDRGALLKELTHLRERNQTLEIQVSRDGKLRQRIDGVLDCDFESFENNWVMEKQLRESNDRIQELEREVRNGRQAIHELTGLREELACAQAREAEHVTTKVHLDRCKQRLEEAGDLKVEVLKAHDQRVAACRERDAMAQEIGQLKSAGQHLDAWKVKAHDLEIHIGEIHAQLRGAEARAGEAEKERQRLADEKTILEGKVQEATLLMAEFQAGQVTSNSLGEMCEPFTAELRERMQDLESRNALLEEQVTVEGAQRVAQLVVEVESLRKMREHFEQRAKELAQELDDRDLKLESTKDQLQEVSEQVKQLEVQCEALRADLLEQREQIANKDEEIMRCNMERRQLEDERDSYREQIELHESQKRELDRHSSEILTQLTETQEEVSRLQEERVELLEHGRTQGDDLQRQVDQLKCLELEAAKAAEDKMLADERVAQMEAQLGSVETTRAELLRRVQLSHFDLQQHERSRADFVRQEEVSAHRQSDLLSRIQDLAAGLNQEVAYRDRLCQQLDDSKRRAELLEELLLCIAPSELQRLEEEGKDALCFTDVSELAQLRAENRRLHAQVSEQRLRNAEEVKRSVQASAKLRQLELSGLNNHAASHRGEVKVAEKVPSANNDSFGMLRKLPDSPGTKQESDDCPRLAAQLCTDALQDHEDNSGIATPKPDACTIFTAPRRGSTAGDLRKSGAPRSSILKKPKASPLKDFDDSKENCNPAQSIGKLGGTGAAPRLRRGGLIGVIV